MARLSFFTTILMLVILSGCDTKMLSVKQIDPINSPQDFFLARNVGTEEEPTYIYDQPNEDVEIFPAWAPANTIKILKKKVFDGVGYLVVRPLATEIYWQRDEDVDPRLVAQAQLSGQIKTGADTWSAEQAFNFSESNLTKTGLGYTAYSVSDIGPYTDVVFGQAWNFEQGNAKQSFYLDSPDNTVKLRWSVRVLEAAIADPENDKKGLSYDISDYQGNVVHTSEADPEEGWVIHRWEFEPDGYECDVTDGRTSLQRFTDKAGLWVDPYLSVDEESSTYTITSAGIFEIRFASSNGWGMDEFYDLANDPSKSTDLMGTGSFDGAIPYIMVRAEGDSDEWRNTNDTNSSNTFFVEHQNELFVKIFVKGYLQETSGGSNTDYPYEIRYTIYSDGRIFTDVKITNDSGSTQAYTGTTQFNHIGLRLNYGSLNFAADYDEEDGAGTSKGANENWCGLLGKTSGDSAVFCVLMYEDTSNNPISVSYFAKAVGTTNYMVFNSYGTNPSWDDGELFHYVMFYHIGKDKDYWDSGDNDVFDHTLAEQWEDQIRDMDIATLTTGSNVDDLNIPLTIPSTNAAAADGSNNFEFGASETLQYTNDSNPRIGHVDVIHDPMITTDGSTERRIELIHCDDNAASNTVVADIGNNATWETSEGTTRNTNNDSVSSDIERGTGLDTGGTYHVEHSATAYDNAFFKQGTISITFTPQFAYDAAADQTIWSLYVDAGDYIQITYDAGNDRYELRVSWGGTLTTLNGDAFTESTSLQQLTKIKGCWDSDENLLQLSINGQVVDNGTNTGTPSSGNAAYVMTGCDCVTDADGTGQLEADVFLDKIQAEDGMKVDHGAHFTGNGSVDTDVAHEEITLLWQGSDTTPIGGNVTSNGDYTQDGPIGTKAFRNDAAGEYASFSTSGNIAAGEGTISFWFKPNSALGADCTLFYADAAFKIWWDDSDNDIAFTYNTDVLNSDPAFAADDTLWHHVEVGWDASTRLYIKIDGQISEQTSGVDSAPTLDATAYLTADDASGTNRADVMISDFFVTDTIGTPQIPVVLGSGPIYAPIREVN
jgi:hypothetical protein